MSSLSTPPLSLLPLDGAPASGSDARHAFVWPTPGLAGFPAPSERPAGQICELEGHNGKTTTGRLMGLDSEAGVVMVAVPPSRTVHTVRFEQFRCLRLLAPLAPTPEPAGAPPTALTAQRPALPFSVNCGWGSSRCTHAHGVKSKEKHQRENP